MALVALVVHFLPQRTQRISQSTRSFQIEKMKKTIYLIAATLLLSFAAFTGKAATVTGDRLTKEAIGAMSPQQKQARLAEIKQRIDEIKATDKSTLTRAERKELRTELRSLKQQSTDIVGIVYIGAGLLVFIGLLLIIFLR
jgi:hypothetical protein